MVNQGNRIDALEDEGGAETARRPLSSPMKEYGLRPSGYEWRFRPPRKSGSPSKVEERACGGHAVQNDVRAMHD